MPAQRDLLSAPEAVRATTLARARNGLRYGVFGELETTGETLRRIVEAVPVPVAQAISADAFVFVPLALGETAHARDTEIARVHSSEYADRAICHRTVPIEGATYTFISTRLMQDRFALAFELFINVGHQYVDALVAKAGDPEPDHGRSNGASAERGTGSAPEAAAVLPERLTTLLWSQALAEVRGETSQDAYEARKRASELNRGSAHASPQHDGRPGQSAAPSHALEEQRTRFFEAAFADGLAIYMLSLALDLDYADLREREYPLLAAPALADRLRLIADLFPPPESYEFAIRYRRRH